MSMQGVTRVEANEEQIEDMTIVVGEHRGPKPASPKGQLSVVEMVSCDYNQFGQVGPHLDAPA